MDRKIERPMCGIRRWSGLLSGAVLALASLAARAALPHLDLDVSLDPAARTFRAVAEWSVPARALRVLLHESLAVESASLDGQPLPAKRGAGGGGLRAWTLALPRAGKLKLAYAGTLPATETGLDHRGVLRALPPMASARGSFLPAGSGWYPQPGALFTYRLGLSLPAGQRGLVEGRLDSETLPGESSAAYRAAFEFHAPADGIHLMTGPWVIGERFLPRANAAPVRLRTYFPAEIAGLSQAYLADCARYLERFAAQIGEYPHTEFSVVAGPLPTGLGMPTLTYLGVEVVKLPFIRATSLGHEVLHNWWGNGVRAELSGGNWSEGLTTFMADYAFKEDESAAAAAAQRLAWLRDFAAVPESGRRPLSAFRSRSHGAEAAVGYGKAAMLFFMLRDLIGAQAFERGIRGFWEGKRFESASWQDLRAAFENASGRPLAAFFHQWLERSGAPALRIESARAAPAREGFALELGFAQPQPAYALSVPVELVFDEHTETRVVSVERSRQSVRIRTPQPPKGVRLDPQVRLWRALEPDLLPPILRQWIVAPAPALAVASPDPGVLSAAATLARALFESRSSPLDAGALATARAPVLLAGLHPDIDAALAREGLPPRPASLAERGSAQVWTVQREGGLAPLLVVSARDAASLAALARALPHYGTQSYLAFEGARMIERGIWPARSRLIPVAP